MDSQIMGHVCSCKYEPIELPVDYTLLLNMILQELQKQTTLLEQIFYKGEKPAEPVGTSIYLVTRGVGDGNWHWKAVITIPDHKPVRHGGCVKGNHVDDWVAYYKAELLALYSALGHTALRSSSSYKITVLSWCNEARDLVNDRKIPEKLPAELHDLANDVLFLLKKLPSMKASQTKLADLIYAKEMNELLDRIREETCSQPAESESSPKKSKLLNEQDSSDRTSTLDSG